MYVYVRIHHEASHVIWDHEYTSMHTSYSITVLIDGTVEEISSSQRSTVQYHLIGP